MFFRALLGKAAIVTTALLYGQVAYSAGYVYLNDSDNSAGVPAFNDHLWPRVILSETKSMAGNQDRYSKYNLIAGQAALIPQVAKLQAKFPAIKYFRMFTPREVQEYENNVYCSQGKGIPFEQTTASTGNCGVYAGHWLYSGGSTTTKTINSSLTNVTVSDPSRFAVGQYAVIYNAPAGSFNNAEHVKITGKNGSTLTIQRGYKSTASSHGSGSIIAQHVLGQGGNNPLNWSYNLSTACPKDASGQVISTYLANFLKNNIKKDREGDTHNIAVSGILFDVDFYFELGSKKSDVNNDLNIDNGISGSGQNMWGVGLDQFYAKVRNHFPNLPIIAGTKNSRGFGSLSGTQVEGWLGGFSATPNYRELDSMFSKYLFSLNDYSDGPLHTHVLNKQSTKLYPVHGSAPDNKPFRLGLTMALMGDGYYGQENSSQYPDPWYDEYAVDVKAGSANYGRAVSGQSGNESAIRANQGWLGSPKGSFYRIYDDGQFAASQSLVGNGSFDSNTNGWSGNNVSVSRDTSTRMDGNASLRASNMNTYQSQAWKAAINGPSIYLVNGTEYTLAYSVRASSIREISVQVGSVNQNVLVGPKWKRRIMTFKAKSTGNHKLSFQVGRENTNVWIDSVYLFQGNANILRRDFDNGIAIANATPSTRTINLGGTYRRILGTQDNVNNGATVTSVTIPAYDGLVLVNQPGSTGGGSTGGGSTGGGSTGGGASEIFIDDVTQAEDGGAQVFTVTINPAPTETVSVDFRTLEGSALYTSDFEEKSGTLVFNPGVTTKNIWVGINNDWKSEGDESYTVSLSNSINAVIIEGVGIGMIPANDGGTGSGTTNNGGAFAAGDECGKPAYKANTERLMILWKDCSTGKWFVRAPGGGSSTALKYDGSIVSNSAFTGVVDFSLENGDSRTLQNGNKTLNFKFRVLNSGQDGTEFKLPDSASGCFSMNHSQIKVGPALKTVPVPFNLKTLGSC